MPGKTNKVADATSRYPTIEFAEVASLSFMTCADTQEVAFNCSIVKHAETFFTIPWDKIVSATSSDPCLVHLASVIQSGFPRTKRQLDAALRPFWNIRYDIFVGQDGVIMYGDRIVVPVSLQESVLQILHSGHQGMSSMLCRANQLFFWPGMGSGIQRIRDECSAYCKNAPSQPWLPPYDWEVPSTPFESIFADYFDLSGHHYLLTGDRLSGWVEVFCARPGSKQSGAHGLIPQLRLFFATFGVPEVLSSDGGPEFKSSATSDFLRLWGIKHRISSSYNPQSNGRAEVAVKKVKRFLISCIGPSGSLDNDKFLRGMLQLRNSPDRDCNLSPAQIIFGRPLRDAFPFVNCQLKFDNPAVHPMWREAWKSKEDALKHRFVRSVEGLNRTHSPTELKLGDTVFVQNQCSTHPNKWDRSGVIIECNSFDQCIIKIDGSDRLTSRNCKFL